MKQTNKRLAAAFALKGKGNSVVLPFMGRVGPDLRRCLRFLSRCQKAVSISFKAVRLLGKKLVKEITAGTIKAARTKALPRR